MTHPERCDVLIVGGGPAGAACATVLAQHGVHVVVCEKKKFPREKICGDCVHPESWPVFDILGVRGKIEDLDSSLITSIQISNLEGTDLHFDVRTRFPFLTIRRSLLDEALLTNAGAAGAEICHSWSVNRISFEGGMWKAAVGTDGHGETTIEAKRIVGADGRNSVVAHAAGEPRRFLRPYPVQRVGVQWLSQRIDTLPGTLFLGVFGSGYGGVVNTGDGTANVACVVTPEMAQRAATNLKSFLADTFGNIPSPPFAAEELLSAGEIRTATPINPRRFVSLHPSVNLIGDAYRTVEPFTGEGILLALQDGVQTAEWILREHFRTKISTGIRRRSTFLANQIFNRILRDPVRANSAVEAGAKMPLLSDMLFSMLFPSR